MHAPAPQPEMPESRRAVRCDVRMQARLRERGTPFDIKIVDLSMTGFRAETVLNVAIGASVWITLPGLSGLEAVVAWRDVNHLGGAFKTPLHPAVFDHIVASRHRAGR